MLDQRSVSGRCKVQVAGCGLQVIIESTPHFLTDFSEILKNFPLSRFSKLQQCSSRFNDSRTDAGISGDNRISESTVTCPILQNEGHVTDPIQCWGGGGHFHVNIRGTCHLSGYQFST